VSADRAPWEGGIDVLQKGDAPDRPTLDGSGAAPPPPDGYPAGRIRMASPPPDASFSSSVVVESTGLLLMTRS
jgi:hypothetical protein